MASTPAVETPEISVPDYVAGNDEIAQNAPAMLAPATAPATAVANQDLLPCQRNALTGKQEHCKCFSRLPLRTLSDVFRPQKRAHLPASQRRDQ